MHLIPVHHWVHQWAVASQQRSRRNAMVAATALTQRRAESREVEDYLAARAVRRAATDAPVVAAASR
jgi:hypothetical protein